MYSCGPLHTDEQGWSNQLEPIYNGSVLIEDIAWKTCQEQWMIGMSGRKESEKSVLAACHNDDNDIYIYIYIVIHRQTVLFYQNSSVWLDTQYTRSRDRNPCVCVCVSVCIYMPACVCVQIYIYINIYVWLNNKITFYLYNFIRIFASFQTSFWVLWYINLCNLFNAKSVFIQINSSLSNNSV